jgi:hypothetical protein
LLFFADVPDAVTVAGMVLIAGSGIMVAQSSKIGRAIARRRGASAGG